MSAVQLWVVKQHGGELRPYTIRAVTTGIDALPSEATEAAIAM